VGESGRERLAYRLLVIASAVLLWTVVVGWTGGFALSVGGMRLSSRSLRNPLILAGIALAAACAAAPRGRRLRVLAAAGARIVGSVDTAVAALNPHYVRRAADLLAAATAVAVVAIGVAWGSFVVGGADSYGYVSQARLWATGTLRVEPAFGDDRPAGLTNAALTPLGYRLSSDQRSIVPIYAPGFPMLASVFARAAGPDAVFYVMPLMAGITVLATYLLGMAVSGRAVGLLAALLMALSPAFLFQLTRAPMSDIVAAGWWTLALVLLPRTRSSFACSLVTGLCAAAAILTRPNLVALAIVPAAWLSWDAATNPARRKAFMRLALYALGPVVASLVVAGLNRYWYGSATESGYGLLAGRLFRWDYLWPNIVNYPRWMIESQTPAIALALLAPWFIRSALVTVCAGFVATICLCYAVYLPMDVWWALRFLLPAFPIVLIFLAVTIVHGARLLPLKLQVLLPVVIAVVIAAQMREFGREQNVLDSTDERRFAQIGRYVAETLPAEAVVFAVMHSGSANFYSGRATVRFEALPPGQFAPIARELLRRGRPVFILMDLGEEEEFARRFGPASRFGTLDARAAKLVPSVALYRVDEPRVRAP